MLHDAGYSTLRLLIGEAQHEHKGLQREDDGRGREQDEAASEAKGYTSHDADAPTAAAAAAALLKFSLQEQHCGAREYSFLRALVGF